MSEIAMSEIAPAAGIRRPALKSDRCPLHRSGGHVQFGSSPGARVLPGFDHAARRVLEHLDGRHDRRTLTEHAIRLGLPAPAFNTMLDALASAGLLEDGAVTPPGWHELSEPRRADLAPVLAALTAALPGPDTGKHVMGRRMRARVVSLGGGPVATQVERLITAAGVGAVTVARHGDHPPAADLILLTTVPSPAEVAALMQSTAVHLIARAGANDAVLGPLVIPGHSSCLRCQDLHRADLDPDWPRVAAQLAAAPPRRSPAADLILAAVLAAYAARAVLDHLDRGERALVDTTAQVTHHDLRWRRSYWSRHPDCGCQAQ
ncbi:MAG: hypothetical protein ACT4PP_10965 [Sporichthyaceae bacterium]